LSVLGQPPGSGPRDPDWVRDAVFYQIFPDRFAMSAHVPKPGALERWEAPPTTYGFKGGDLLGIAEHLDELRELGITALYLCPVFASASNHRYTTYDYESVDPLLGGDAALRELLDKSHERGMRVILDGVFNHASRGFWPFHHVLENGGSSPYRDWFCLDPEVLAGRRGLTAYPSAAEVEAIGRIRSRHSLPLTPAGDDPLAAAVLINRADVEMGLPSRQVLGHKAWWDHAALPKLNHSNPAVREYIYGVVERWLRFGIDGWRLDAPEEIAEAGFWEGLRERALAVNPDAYLVGELWNPAPDWLAGDRFHGLMNYPLAEAILSYTGAGRLDRALVARTHEYAQHVRAIDGSEFRRQLESLMATYPPEVASLQLNLLDSHDTPRIISLAGGDAATVRLSYLIQMTLPGAPCIYYGDEIGLAGREDPDCRRGYAWDPIAQDRGLREFTAGLIGVRHDHSAIRRGRFRMLAAQGSAVAYGMFAADGPGDATYLDGAPGSSGESAEPLAGSRAVVVAVNAGDTTGRLRLEAPELAGCSAVQLTWPGLDWHTGVAPAIFEDGVLDLEIAAREGAVIEAVATG
jgi:cyclomaltodextrinase / maltogenic alpha-amylase / neopullulanase